MNKKILKNGVQVHAYPPDHVNSLSRSDTAALYDLGFTEGDILAIDPRRFEKLKRQMRFNLHEKNLDENTKSSRRWYIRTFSRYEDGLIK